MAGWFELTQNNDGQFHFILKAGNGETILASELYATKSSAQNGIAAVQANAALDERYLKKEAVNGTCYFVLTAANHQVIGVSQMYAEERSRDEGIHSVKQNGSSAEIKDLTT